MMRGRGDRVSKCLRFHEELAILEEESFLISG